VGAIYFCIARSALVEPKTEVSGSVELPLSHCYFLAVLLRAGLRRATLRLPDLGAAAFFLALRLVAFFLTLRLAFFLPAFFLALRLVAFFLTLRLAYLLN
jgi:hypothetical protein